MLSCVVMCCHNVSLLGLRSIEAHFWSSWSRECRNELNTSSYTYYMNHVMHCIIHHMMHCIIHHMMHYIMHHMMHCIIHHVMHCIIHHMMHCIMHHMVHCIMHHMVHCIMHRMMHCIMHHMTHCIMQYENIVIALAQHVRSIIILFVNPPHSTEQAVLCAKVYAPSRCAQTFSPGVLSRCVSEYG